MDHVPCKCTDRALEWLPVVLSLVYADPLPFVLLVVQFEGCAFRREKLLKRGVPGEAPKLSQLIPMEEGDVFQLELYCSFQFVPGALNGVLPHPKQIIECD